MLVDRAGSLRLGLVEEKGLAAVLIPRSRAPAVVALYLSKIGLTDDSAVDEVSAKGLLQTGQIGVPADKDDNAEETEFWTAFLDE